MSLLASASPRATEPNTAASAGWISHAATVSLRRSKNRKRNVASASI